MFNILDLNSQHDALIKHTIDNKTKPPGALGDLETLAFQLAKIIAVDNKILINRPCMLVFAGDHGIAKEGISIAPSEVTQQMVNNFLAGGAAINCFCRVNQIQLEVIDAGILAPLEHPKLHNCSLGQGTNNFLNEPAMSITAVEKGIALGGAMVAKQTQQGSNVIGFGEMGIGNTSSAAALLSVLLDWPVADCVGRGTGIDDVTFLRKQQLIEQAVTKHKSQCHDVLSALALLGGFEIVEMCGAMLATAEARCVILVDGFIASVAALAAIKINSNAAAYMVFCHESEEKAHRKLLKYLNAKPLLKLSLRLGEGTGAALAMPLLKSAAEFYNQMASFDAAGIQAV
ncbi:nicotinate-nucleotide--dimethylbenzimidazole phosphoribosyltransferase [Aliikangiella sp. IMCC44653]